MKQYLHPIALALASLAISSCQSTKKIQQIALKDAFKDDFLIGCAIDQRIISQHDSKAQALILEQFNAVSPESVLKPEYIHPAPNRWNFAPGDAYCQFAAEHGLKALGHTLVWHNQTPNFFWLNADGTPRSQEDMRAHLVEYLEKVTTHFAGKVYAWDVVNEILDEDGNYRHDKGWEKYYKDLDDLVCLAFSTAQRCDPNAELYYNDFNMWRPSKVAGAVRLVKMLQSKGIRIDGVGIQAHWGLNFPEIKDVENAIDQLSALGVKVMITEIDIDVLPLTKEGQVIGQSLSDPVFQRPEFVKFLNPYRQGLPKKVDKQLADRYEELMRVFHKKRDKIDRVTFWGLHDGVSWKNDYPVPHRTNYPMLFDRNLQKKKAYEQVIKVGQGRK